MDSKKVIFLESEEDGTSDILMNKNNGDDSQFVENNQFGGGDNDNDESDSDNNK